MAFHQLHADRNLNFQLNRALFEGRLEDIAAVAPRIHDYADWKRELLGIAAVAEREARVRNAFAYYRAAEFFMAVDDQDRATAYDKLIAMFEHAHPELRRARVPYDGAFLPAIEIPAPTGAAGGTIVVHAGFDAFIEEFYELGTAIAAAGYRVIMFDGPGQGTAVHRYHLTMTADWERPVAAVLDHFALADVTLIGISLGGYLALRAAAYEPRIGRVVAFDAMTDFFACLVSRKGPIAELALRGLLAAHLGPAVNRAMRIAMRRDLLAAWGVPRAMYLAGTTTPYDMFRVIDQFTTRACSPLIRCDVLVLGGADDHFVPVSQYHDQLKWLTHARSVTGRLFTAADGAEQHCQFGNIDLALTTILTWVAEHSKQAP